ncbi:sugar transferase [Aequorivita viscosa]|uniref:Sugar transferase involved in LPS biosynthesis (Colanic, teichoic acid) n=1 Tax=Aequorivita viscosa TaxID=797419 RepID=A0A1M6FMJ8_9FLAO|nr:sugar transferase [Aequorivita viscosa]SDW75242.1 Sugar transferase involved in LPS biosynthesis (colanic, teichoic acid) [Aequorivita viscosa]SHI98978.1 Sugar transferase involved in LPS biosynthesis (colanic, teichoic acid) [Aequorivita viscosa]
MYKRFIKRGLDFLTSSLVLLFLSPLLGLIALLLAIAQKGNVFFIQERPGKNANIFKIIKFKTMTDDIDAEGRLLPDEKRLTNIGKFVRSTSIDELPQLINVVKGDMAIVGPRPLLVKYLPLYNDFQSKRHDVRPGITGWAQVNGRNAISWEKKFELDVWYTQNLSFLLDLKIILLTIKKVFWREGISAATSATMETFTGNKKNETT